MKIFLKCTLFLVAAIGLANAEFRRIELEVRDMDCASCVVSLRNSLKKLKGVESVDILKVDTEGCEMPILRSLAGLLPRVGVVYVEYHDDDARLDIDRLLGATHLLCQGRVLAPHRGEFCYVARTRLPSTLRNGQIRALPDKKRGRRASPPGPIV